MAAAEEVKEAAATRSVLLAVDGSDHSKRAFDFYVAQVMKPDDMVYLAHVFSAPGPPALSLKHPSPEPWDTWREEVDRQVKEAKDMMKQFQSMCTEKQLKSKLIIHSGSAGEGLIEVIKEHKPDMVLMGSRGLNLLRRTFLGSVSSYVIHHSSTPVTVVPPPEA